MKRVYRGAQTSSQFLGPRPLSPDIKKVAKLTEKKLRFKNRRLTRKICFWLLQF